jgi:hypothetical protein
MLQYAVTTTAKKTMKVRELNSMGGAIAYLKTNVNGQNFRHTISRINPKLAQRRQDRPGDSVAWIEDLKNVQRAMRAE